MKSGLYDILTLLTDSRSGSKNENVQRSQAESTNNSLIPVPSLKQRNQALRQAEIIVTVTHTNTQLNTVSINITSTESVFAHSTIVNTIAQTSNFTTCSDSTFIESTTVNISTVTQTATYSSTAEFIQTVTSTLFIDTTLTQTNSSTVIVTIDDCTSANILAAYQSALNDFAQFDLAAASSEALSAQNWIWSGNAGWTAATNAVDAAAAGTAAQAANDAINSAITNFMNAFPNVVNGTNFANAALLASQAQTIFLTDQSNFAAAWQNATSAQIDAANAAAAAAAEAINGTQLRSNANALFLQFMTDPSNDNANAYLAASKLASLSEDLEARLNATSAAANQIAVTAFNAQQTAYMAMSMQAAVVQELNQELNFIKFKYAFAFVNTITTSTITRSTSPITSTTTSTDSISITSRFTTSSGSAAKSLKQSKYDRYILNQNRY